MRTNRNRISHELQGWGSHEMANGAKAYVLQCERWMRKGYEGFEEAGSNSDDLRKIYCDASYSKENRDMSFAVVDIGDGFIECAFVGWREGVLNSCEAEVYAILQALVYLQGKGVKEAVIYSDSFEAITSALQGSSPKGGGSAWVSQCSKFLGDNPRWRIQHIMREENSIADELARWARLRKRSWNNNLALPRAWSRNWLH